MGTRADFYVGEGESAIWLGSVGWDGYEWDDEGSALLKSKTADEFTENVSAIASDRDDWTSPDLGWPWPWANSNTTDYAYVFDGGKVRVFVFGSEKIGVAEDGDYVYSDSKFDGFPDMSEHRKTTIGKRSGLMVFSG
jgi:hypothetical protein